LQISSIYGGVDGRIILNWIFKKWEGEVGTVDLAEDRDRDRAGACQGTLRFSKFPGIS